MVSRLNHRLLLPSFPNLVGKTVLFQNSRDFLSATCHSHTLKEQIYFAHKSQVQKAP